MTIRPWLHALEPDFDRESAREEHDIEAEDAEWDKSRESALPWEELGGEAA